MMREDEEVPAVLSGVVQDESSGVMITTPFSVDTEGCSLAPLILRKGEASGYKEGKNVSDREKWM
jgi:hypothetical protein